MKRFIILSLSVLGIACATNQSYQKEPVSALTPEDKVQHPEYSSATPGTQLAAGSLGGDYKIVVVPTLSTTDCGLLILSLRANEKELENILPHYLKCVEEYTPFIEQSCQNVLDTSLTCKQAREKLPKECKEAEKTFLLHSAMIQTTQMKMVACPDPTEV